MRDGLTRSLMLLLPLIGACADAPKQTTITYLQILGGKDRDKIVHQMVAAFEKANPEVRVELQSVPWDQAHEKLVTMVATGNPPDVVEMADAWIGELAAMEALENLEPYLARLPYKADIKEVAWRAGRIYRDTFYAFPFGFYVKALFYRRDWFAADKIAPPKTVDDFLHVAQHFTSPQKNKYGYSLRGGRGGFDLITYFMFVFNGSKAYFDDTGRCTFARPGAVAGLQFLADLYCKHRVAPPDAINFGYNELVAAFYSGVTAMYTNDPETIKTQKEHLGDGRFMTAPLPLGPHSQRFIKLGFGSYCIMRGSQQKNTAWRFVAFMNSPEMSTFWAKNNYLLPITNAGEADPYFQQEIFEPFFQQLADPEQVYFPPYYLPEYSALFESAHVDFQKLLLGEATAAEIAQKWADVLTAAEARYRQSHTEGSRE